MMKIFSWAFIVLFWCGYNYLKTTIKDLREIFLNTRNLVELENEAHKWWCIMTKLCCMALLPMENVVFQHDAHFLRSIYKRS